MKVPQTAAEKFRNTAETVRVPLHCNYLLFHVTLPRREWQSLLPLSRCVKSQCTCLRVPTLPSLCFISHAVPLKVFLFLIQSGHTHTLALQTYFGRKLRSGFSGLPECVWYQDYSPAQISPVIKFNILPKKSCWSPFRSVLRRIRVR